MKLFIASLGLVMLVPGTAYGKQDKNAAPGKECRERSRIGSHVDRKVCRTPAEWKRFDERWQGRTAPYRRMDDRVATD